MKRFETPEDLPQEGREAVIDLLYRMADDELIIGHRASEWTGLAPILEEDIAISSMSQDEMGHALTFYNLLHELGEPDPDTNAFSRNADDYRCARFVSLANGDWAFSVLRQYLYDAAESVRLRALCDSAYVPLAQLARKLMGEEKYHLMHGRIWVDRLGNGTDTSREKMATAMQIAYPHALGLFEPTSVDEALARLGIAPLEADLCRQWEDSVKPVLEDAGLELPEATSPVYGGRTGDQPAELRELLESMQVVYSADPGAKW